MVSLRTCSLQNVSDECRNNNPSAKLETNTMKKCNSTKRSNLKYKNRKCYLSFITEVYPVVMVNLLASSVTVWLRTRRWRMIIWTFPFPFGHFHFNYCWWLACLWLAEILLPICDQRSISKKMCVSACFYFVWSYMKYINDENKKMAPISLKDPNIQGLTEEFVKALTGFKVISAHIM